MPISTELSCEELQEAKILQTQLQEAKMSDYIRVRFEGNSSHMWDGKVADVPVGTVVRSGRWDTDGCEFAEVHWPGKGKAKKGKAVKVGKYVVVGDTDGKEEEDRPTKRPHWDQGSGSHYH